MSWRSAPAGPAWHRARASPRRRLPGRDRRALRRRCSSCSRSRSPSRRYAAGRGGMLVFALSGGPDTLDPQRTSATLSFQVMKSLYDTLVEPDAHGVLVPDLAASWSMSPDGIRVDVPAQAERPVPQRQDARRRGRGRDVHPDSRSQDRLAEARRLFRDRPRGGGRPADGAVRAASGVRAVPGRARTGVGRDPAGERDRVRQRLREPPDRDRSVSAGELDARQRAAARALRRLLRPGRARARRRDLPVRDGGRGEDRRPAQRPVRRGGRRRSA